MPSLLDEPSKKAIESEVAKEIAAQVDKEAIAQMTPASEGAVEKQDTSQGRVEILTSASKSADLGVKFVASPREEVKPAISSKSGAWEQRGSAASTVGQLKQRLTMKTAGRSLSKVEELAIDAMEKIGGDKELFTTEEVWFSIKEFNSMHKDIAFMKNTLLGLSLFFVILCGAMFGLMWVTVELGKDFRPESSGALKSADNDFIGTTAVAHTLPLSAITTLSRKDLRALTTIDLDSGTGWSSHKVASVTKRSTGGVVVETQQGRTISIDKGGGVYLNGTASVGGRRLNAESSTLNLAKQTMETGESESSSFLGVVINEVYPNQLSGETEFVELYNTLETSVDLTGWTMKDLNLIKKKKPGKSIALLSIEPQSFVLVSTSGFKLNNGGDDVCLYNAKNVEQDCVTYTRSEEGRTWARLPDGGDWSGMMQTPTPGKSNVVESQGSTTASGDAPCGGSCGDGLCFATWNIQNLGPSKASRSEVMAAIQSVVARYDLVAIQELSQTPSEPYVCGKNTEEAICKTRPNNGADFTVSASPRIGDEQYVLLARNEFASVDSGMQYPDAHNIHSRPPYAFEVAVDKGSMRCNIAVAQTHTSPSKATEEINNFPNVLKWMQDTYSGADHVVLAGDYNADGSYFKDHDKWTSSILDAAFQNVGEEGKKYVLLTPNNMDSTVATSSNAYDRIIVDETMAGATSDACAEDDTACAAKVFSLEDVNMIKVRAQGCKRAVCKRECLSRGDSEDKCEDECKGEHDYVPERLCSKEQLEPSWPDDKTELAKELSDHHPVEVCLRCGR